MRRLQIPIAILKFTYGIKPESIYNVNEYIGEGSVVKTNAHNHFRDPLEACMVADGLNRELISHLTFYSNEYTHGKLDHTKGMFAGYEWTNITIAETY